MELDPSDIYSLRVLVFTEIEPQSNKYCQVILDKEHYKMLTKILGTYTGNVLEGNIKEIQIETSVEEYDLPDLKPFV